MLCKWCGGDNTSLYSVENENDVVKYLQETNCVKNEAIFLVD